MISVVVPIYNVEDYLEECIESILCQTYKDYEIILVNDGSEDRSREIAERYSLKYSNIILINQENQGLSAARNTGIKYCKGEYIYFLDSDDKICVDLLQKCMDNFNKYDVDIVSFGYKTFNDREIIKESTLENTGVVLSGYEFFKNSAENTLGQNFVAWSYMYKKKFLMDNKLEYRYKLIYEDSEMFIRFLMLNPKIITINEHLYMYRIRKNSIMTKKYLTEDNLESINIIINTYLFYMNKHPELEKEFKRFIIIFIRRKFDVLLKLKNLNSTIIEKEIRDIIDLKNELKIEVDSIYIEKLKDRLESIGESSSVFHEKDVIELINEVEEVRKEKISDIPLGDQNKRVGIYGLGDHTKKMLDYYNKNVHNIKAQVVLIDSYLQERYSEEYNLKIINVKDIDQYDLDCVVISAPYSEKKMYKNLLKYKYKGTIYRFYDDNGMILFI